MAKMLTTQEKAQIRSHAIAGDLMSQGWSDHEADLAAVKAGKIGKLMVVKLATAAPITLATIALGNIDGVAPVAGDLILVKNQVTSAENGIYVASLGAWARAKNPDGTDVLFPSMQVVMEKGNTLADTTYMLTTNGPIVAGTTTPITFALVTSAGVSAADLVSVLNGKGASLVGVEDAASLLTAVTVENALAELVAYVPVSLADPGTGVAIPVLRSATVNITTAAAETNTLAIPSYLGQVLVLNMNVRAVGDRVVTSAQRINQAANTIMTFGAAGDCIVLRSILIGGALRWQVVSNDGVALS